MRGGPAKAAVAHGTTLSWNCRRNRNGNSVNTAKKMRYHVSGRVASVGSNRLKCHAHSNAVTQASPTAGIQSREKSFVTPSTSTTSSSARPKTGDGFASCNRNVAIMSSRNGRMAEIAGNCAAMFSGRRRSSLVLIPPVVAGDLNFRASQTPVETKKTANAPNKKNEVGRPVSVAGILKIKAPVAVNVSTSTTNTG